MFPGFCRPARTWLEKGVAVAGDAAGVEGVLDQGQWMAGGAQQVDLMVGGRPDAHAQAAQEAGDLEAQLDEGGKLAPVAGLIDCFIQFQALEVGGGEQVLEARCKVMGSQLV
jgi:hypothetical protein